MAEPARRVHAYDDVVAAPAHLVAELVGGELVTSPRPALRHAQASSVLGELLGEPFRRGRGGPGGWLFLDGAELHLGSAVLVPDLAGWRRERLPRVPDAPWLELAPDWLCEVLSPSTAGLDRVRKLPLYAAAGVGHVWFVDPLARTLEVLAREGARWFVAEAHEGAAPIRVRPFDAVELDLGALWDEGAA